MKILNLETYDFGGAGIARLYFLDECKKRGWDAKLLVLEKRSQRDDVIPIVTSKISLLLIKIFYKLVTFIKTKGVIDGKYNFFNVNVNLISANRILRLYGDKPDAIVVSWITNLVNFKTINKLQKLTNAKVIFIMADNANITGGCHYPFECVGYQSDCKECPALRKGNKTAYNTLLHKKKYLPNNSVIIGTSNDCVRARLSSVFKNVQSLVMVSTIIYPYEFDKNNVRDDWRIDKTSFVISFGASNIDSERKGFKYLLEALKSLAMEMQLDNVLLLIAGDNCNVTFPPNLQVKLLGRLSTEELFKMYYASDVFVCPSIEDSGPLMVNQAVSCGIPVVAFNVGVVADLIVHKKNGYIAEIYNSEQLKDGMIYFMSNNHDGDMIKKFNRHMLKDLSQINMYSYLDNLESYIRTKVD